MKFPFEKIDAGCKGFMELNGTARERLSLYAEMLTEWNEKINLTAITEPQEIAVKHFLDCLMIFKYENIPQGASVIDIGTGAGFPGVVMKIARPDLELTLLDSLAKRITFLDALCGELGLPVKTLHSRAEEGAKERREAYDFAVSRAVANMRVLCEYCMPYVKLGGCFIAMKGASAAAEAADAENAVKILGGTVESMDLFTLEGAGERGMIRVKKISHTPTQYPRNPAKISKQPL